MPLLKKDTPSVPDHGLLAAGNPQRSASVWRRLWPLRWAAAALLALLLLLMLFENSLIFIPSRFPEGDWQPRGIAFEDAWFTAADGTKLHGWYLPAEQPRAYVLFAHGNAGHVAHRAPYLQHLQQEQRVAVLAFDYRGFGRSAGRPFEAGVLADARAARDWLAVRAQIAPQDIVLLGESIGGAVMVDLAAAEGARGLILENTFTSIPDVAAWHFPWLPVRTLMRTRLDSAAKIGHYQGPLLQCHGDADTIVPFAPGERLHEAAREPKQLIVNRGGDHNDPRSDQWLSAMD
ncbi:MAG: alpha/beta hydrolase, partial [Singulisphaera sp.]